MENRRNLPYEAIRQAPSFILFLIRYRDKKFHSEQRSLCTGKKFGVNAVSGFATSKTTERTGKKSGANIVSGFATNKTTERTGKKSGVNAVSGFATGKLLNVPERNPART